MSIRRLLRIWDRTIVPASFTGAGFGFGLSLFAVDASPANTFAATMLFSGIAALWPITAPVLICRRVWVSMHNPKPYNKVKQ